MVAHAPGTRPDSIGIPGMRAWPIGFPRGIEEERAVGDYDLVVVGGGAGGLVAAREARRRGARVVIVQEGPMGGDCTFTGCVPSKALLAAAAAGVGFDEAMVRVHAAVARIAATEDAAALSHDGIVVIAGYARFMGPTQVDVDGRTVRATVDRGDRRRAARPPDSGAA